MSVQAKKRWKWRTYEIQSPTGMKGFGQKQGIEF
jgi:hypothetical protein